MAPLPSQGAATVTPAPSTSATPSQPAGLMSWDDAMKPTAPVGGSPPASGSKKISGVLANAAAGPNDAIAGDLGLPVDAATGAINLGIRGVNGLTGTGIPQITNPIGGSNSIKSAMGWMGADPRNVVPANQFEQLVRSTTGGVAGALLPLGAARAVPEMAGMAGAVQDALGSGGAGTVAAAGGVGGLTGQVAANLAPDRWKSTADAAGNILGGGLAAGTVEAGKALIAGLGDAAGGFLGPMVGKARAVTDETGAPIMVPNGEGGSAPVMAKPGQAKLAGQQIAAAATNLPAVRDALAEPRPPLVPGSQPTTFQMTRDSGLGQLERATYTRSPQPFLDRAAEQNAARVGAVQGLAPADADPAAVGDAFRNHLAELDAQSQAWQAQQLREAQGATSAIGSTVPAGADQQASILQRFGQAIRAKPAAGDDAAKAQTTAIFKSIDPDGTLMVPMSGIRQGARDVVSGLPQSAKALDPETQAILGTAQMQPAQQSFRELSALRSRITNQLMEARVDPKLNQDKGVLTALLSHVDDTLAGGVEDQAAEDAAAVRAGTMAPEETITAKLGARSQDWQQKNDATESGRQGQGSNSTDAGAGHIPSGVDRVPGLAGAGREGGQRSGASGRDSRLAPRTADGRKPPSLTTFLARRGGIRDPGGDLAAMDAHLQRVGLVRTNGGQSLDYAREAAEEAGYLRPGSDTNDLLEAIRGELSGRKVYPAEQGAALEAGQRASREAAVQDDALIGAREAVHDAAAETGVKLLPEETDHAAQLVLRGAHPEEAIRQAVLHSEDTEMQRDLARRQMGPLGMPGAEQPHLALQDRVVARLGTWNQAAADRYAAGRASHAARMATYHDAPGVGAILKPGKLFGSFDMEDSSVPSQIFASGKEAAERMQAYRQAGGDMDAVAHYAAFDLRRTAETDDGTLDPKKYESWMRSHREAMSAMPTLAKKFQTAVDARKTLDDVAARQAEATKAYQTAAVKRFLGEHDPATEVGTILKGNNALATMSDLARKTAGNPTARAGLQKAVVDFILRDLESNRAAGTTGTQFLKTDAFQTFTKKTPQALATIFSPEQMKAIRGIAEDIQNSETSWSGTKLPGGSNTAQDTEGGRKYSMLSRVRQAVQRHVSEAGIAGILGGEAAGMHGIAVGISLVVVKDVVSAMRAAGMKQAEDLATLAMLHPTLAKALLTKVPNEATARMIGPAIGRQILRITASQANASAPAPVKPGRQPPSVFPGWDAPRVSQFRAAQ